MRAIELSHSYLKDLRLARKRNLPEEELNVVIKKLANDEILEAKYLDHPLKGKYAAFCECHICPNWLLIYKKEDYLKGNKLLKILYLARTGTHSDLF